MSVFTDVICRHRVRGRNYVEGLALHLEWNDECRRAFIVLRNMCSSFEPRTTIDGNLK